MVECYGNNSIDSHFKTSNTILKKTNSKNPIYFYNSLKDIRFRVIRPATERPSLKL